MMKMRIAPMITAAIMALVCFSSCGEKNTSEDVKLSSGAAPFLTLSSANGNPGDIVPITFSVSGADEKWSSCGIHILYDETLECMVSEIDPTVPNHDKGEAIANMTTSVAVIWTEDRIDELVEKGMYSVFFASVGAGDSGKDGDIATFYFRIPENAEAGTVYNIEFFNREGDMFANSAVDEDFQEYAFNHWQNGTITVE